MKTKIFRFIFIILIISGIIFIITRPAVIGIIDNTPKNGSKQVAVDTIVNIIFNRILSEDEKKNITLTITPNIEISSSWAGKQLNFAAKNNFKTQTTYSIAVSFYNKDLLKSSFRTVDFTPEELKQQAIEQFPAERQFSEEWAQYVNSNPWVIKLPIETNNYRVVYDSVRKSFRIRILVVVNDQQKQEFTDQALSDLKNIGVTQVPIPFYVLTQ